MNRLMASAHGIVNRSLLSLPRSFHQRAHRRVFVAARFDNRRGIAHSWSRKVVCCCSATVCTHKIRAVTPFETTLCKTQRKTFLALRRPLFSSWSLLSIALTVPASAQDAAPATPGVATGAASPSTSAPGELEALRAQVNALQDQLKALPALLDRLDKLEKQQKEAATSPPVVSGFKLPITITGVMQAQNVSSFNQEGPSPRANDTFVVRRAQIRLAVNITPRISGLMMFDPARVLNANFRPAATGTGGTIAINRGASILQDLQLSFLLRSRGTGAHTNRHFLDAGQFKIPIGYESTLIPAIAVPLVERSLMFTIRDPFGGGYGQLRDTGVQLRGNQGQFSYRLGVFNGLGERQNDVALSDSKAVAGLLSFNSTDVPGLQLGISGGYGKTGVNGSVSGRPTRSIFNAFAVYKHDKFSFQGEYMTGKSETLGTVTARDIRGYYAGVGYSFTPKLEGLFRYDTFDTDRNAAAGVDSTVRDLILGLNYFIKGNNAKIQVNLVRRSGAAGGGAFTPPADMRNDRTELRTQAQIAF